MSITVSNLTKIYGEQKAVNDISFAIGNNEIVGFLGPNGAGKSTTMKIITGYLAADAGTAIVRGINVNTDPLEAKKQIGYLPKEIRFIMKCMFGNIWNLLPVFMI